MAFFVSASLAFADATSGSAAKIVVLATDAEGPTSARVAAELRALGFDVRDVHDDAGIADPSSSGRLSTTVKVLGASAVVRIIDADETVTVWIVDRTSNRLISRGVVVDADPVVLALRSVEVLRTSLIDLSAPPLPSAEPAPSARPSLDRRTAPEHPTGDAEDRPWAASLGLAAALGAPHSTAAFNVHGSFHVSTRAGWGIEGLVLAPVVASELTAPDGAAHIHFAMVGAAVRWEARTRAVIAPDFAVGVGGIYLRVEGIAAPGSVGRVETTLLTSPFLRLGGRLAMTQAFRLRVDALGATTFPRPIIEFANRRVSEWGRPLLIGSLGIELDWR